MFDSKSFILRYMEKDEPTNYWLVRELIKCGGASYLKLVAKEGYILTRCGECGYEIAVKAGVLEALQALCFSICGELDKEIRDEQAHWDLIEIPEALK